MSWSDEIRGLILSLWLVSRGRLREVRPITSLFLSSCAIKKHTNSNLQSDNWVTVPTNSTLTISKQTVMIHPIIDEFYSANPAHERSAGFAQAKGQTVTGPDKRVLTSDKSPELGGSEDEGGLGHRGADAVVGAIRRLRVEC